MRLPTWATVGGTLTLAGVIWTAYYAFVIYQPINCAGGVACPAIAPLWSEGWFWLGLVVAGVGLAILVTTFVRWLFMRRRIQRAPVAQG